MASAPATSGVAPPPADVSTKKLASIATVSDALKENEEKRAELFAKFDKDSTELLADAMKIITGELVSGRRASTTSTTTTTTTSGGGTAATASTPAATTVVPPLEVAHLPDTYKLERLVGATAVSADDIRTIANSYRSQLKDTFEAIAMRELHKRVRDLKEHAKDSKKFIDTMNATIGQGLTQTREKIHHFFSALEGIINHGSLVQYGGPIQVTVSNSFVDPQPTDLDEIATVGGKTVTQLQHRFDTALGAITKKIDDAVAEANRRASEERQAQAELTVAREHNEKLRNDLHEASAQNTDLRNRNRDLDQQLKAAYASRGAALEAQTTLQHVNAQEHANRLAAEGNLKTLELLLQQRAYYVDNRLTKPEPVMSNVDTYVGPQQAQVRIALTTLDNVISTLAHQLRLLDAVLLQRAAALSKRLEAPLDFVAADAYDGYDLDNVKNALNGLDLATQAASATAASYDRISTLLRNIVGSDSRVGPKEKEELADFSKRLDSLRTEVRAVQHGSLRSLEGGSPRSSKITRIAGGKPAASGNS